MTETLFYNTFDKFPTFSGPFPFIIPLDQTSIVGDHMVVNLIQKGDYIGALYLDIGTNQLEDLEYFEILISKTLCWRFNGEIIHILRELRTPVQKKKLFDNIVQIPINPFPAIEEVQIRLKVNSQNVQESNMRIIADFIYTGKNTDGKFFIEQIQQVNTPNDLRFRHCVKELIVVAQDTLQSGFNFSNTVSHIDLYLNNELKCSDSALFFSTVQHMRRHTSLCPNVFVIPFALNPEEPSPSGTVNMSMIQRQRIVLTPKQQNVRIYALSYNVLSVENNLGSLQFIL